MAFIREHILIRIIFFVFLASLLLILFYFLIPFPEGFLKKTSSSIKVYDRNGVLLMDLFYYKNSYYGADAGFSEEITLSEVPETFKKMLLFSEDKRFYYHFGVDVKALFRSIYQNLIHWRFVSGGSTINQQLAKMKYGIRKNNLLTKFLEIIRAIKINLYYKKDDILVSYLNHIYMGNRIYGIKKAAEIYFHKRLENLNLLETAALISIIKSPSYYNIYTKTSRIEEKARELLKGALDNKIISEEEYKNALERHLFVFPFEMEIRAPHFCFWVVEEAIKICPNKRITEIRTSLDYALYQKCLEIVRNRVDFLKDKNVNDASIVLIDNKKMEIIVMIGGIDYFKENGQINGVLMPRQAGSTMKPFTYALAIEKRKITPATILPDIYTEFPSSVGKYIPRNYNELFHGPVRAAVALGSSYNVPAVYLLTLVGLSSYYEFLKKIGFSSIKRPPDFYGLGLTLGNADVTLLELAHAYTIFPNLGIYKPLKGILSIKTSDGKIIKIDNSKKEKRVISKETSLLITRILSDYDYKIPGFGVNSPIKFPFPIAVKTGTTKDFRDNIIVAFDKGITIGIWSGNLSGEPMRNLPSANGTGILLRDIVGYLLDNGHTFSQHSLSGAKLIPSRICRLSGELATPLCDSQIEYFIEGTEPHKKCSWHRDGKVFLPAIFQKWAQNNLDNFFLENPGYFKIIHPGNGDIFKIERNVSLENQKIEFRVVGGSDNVRWFANGSFIGRGAVLRWKLQRGEYLITAEDGGNRDNVKIIVVD